MGLMARLSVKCIGLAGRAKGECLNAPGEGRRGTRNHGKRIAYTTLVELLYTLGKKAGITKPVNPYSFRHSRLSYFGDFCTEAQLSYLAGWRQGTKMARVYVRPKRSKEAVLRSYGLEEPEEKAEVQAISCRTCSSICSPDSTYCRRCGSVLKTETALDTLQKQKDFGTMEKEILYKGPEVVNQAVQTLQQNEQMTQALMSSYPKYTKFVRKNTTLTR